MRIDKVAPDAEQAQCPGDITNTCVDIVLISGIILREYYDAAYRLRP